jgi:hypothetical protein
MFDILLLAQLGESLLPSVCSCYCFQLELSPFAVLYPKRSPKLQCVQDYFEPRLLLNLRVVQMGSI